ncbi:hypothetical protein K505DRAFT_157734 [Melanomma pulvis-pyrius CBS 109.77]|uniref:Uncharacterized protein n=1 Tax=Melanomma pulvis-pyrius CBS 109.77 TaxID=1314802 RepID=A0A6A6WPA9_9PLEO|nr:hypothetical protein K505DRAFT_157734 [Melanomma pulvis-pyrius CBS 109.77]
MPRFTLPTRLPIRAALFAGKRTAPAFIRHNSSSSSGASRILELAGNAERPSPLEASVPVMWAVCGALVYTAFNRIDEKSGSENVDTLLIV